MTPKQFNELDEQEQAELVWEGTFIGHRLDETHEAFKEHELLDIYLPKN